MSRAFFLSLALPFNRIEWSERAFVIKIKWRVCLTCHSICIYHTQVSLISWTFLLEHGGISHAMASECVRMERWLMIKRKRRKRKISLKVNPNFSLFLLFWPHAPLECVSTHINRYLQSLIWPLLTGEHFFLSFFDFIFGTSIRAPKIVIMCRERGGEIKRGSRKVNKPARLN